MEVSLRSLYNFYEFLWPCWLLFVSPWASRASTMALKAGAGNSRRRSWPPFSNLHTGGPDVLFSGKETVIDDIFQALREVQSNLGEQAA